MQRKVGIQPALDFLTEIGDSAIVHWVTQEDHERAVYRLGQRHRRNLSLVDCMSFVVMEMYECTTAFAYDSEFRNRGFRASWLIPIRTRLGLFRKSDDQWHHDRGDRQRRDDSRKKQIPNTVIRHQRWIVILVDLVVPIHRDQTMEERLTRPSPHIQGHRRDHVEQHRHTDEYAQYDVISSARILNRGFR